MCFRKKKIIEIINSKYHKKEYVDFFYKDDIYFGRISNIYLEDNDKVIYDIDIAGQCPTTFTHIEEEKIVRIHKEN